MDPSLSDDCWESWGWTRQVIESHLGVLDGDIVGFQGRW
jgi:hypothetical protein